MPLRFGWYKSQLSVQWLSNKNLKKIKQLKLYLLAWPDRIILEYHVILPSCQELFYLDRDRLTNNKETTAGKPLLLPGGSRH